VNAILDTCALLDLLLVGYQPPLPAPWGASAISWCEIAWKHRHGHLDLGEHREDFFADLRRIGVVEIPISGQLCLAAVDLAWEHSDPADRLIVATAKARALPLITRDRVITAFYRPCRW